MDLLLKILQLVLGGIVDGILGYARDKRADEALESKGRTEAEKDNVVDAADRADKIGAIAGQDYGRDRVLDSLHNYQF